MATVRVVSSVVNIGQRGSASGTSTAERAANRLWLAAENIGALLTTAKASALLLKLVRGDGRKLSISVVLSLVLVNLVDRDSGVDDGWLDGLFAQRVGCSRGSGGGRARLRWMDWRR